MSPHFPNKTADLQSMYESGMTDSFYWQFLETPPPLTYPMAHVLKIKIDTWALLLKITVNKSASDGLFKYKHILTGHLKSDGRFNPPHHPQGTRAQWMVCWE